MTFETMLAQWAEDEKSLPTEAQYVYRILVPVHWTGATEPPREDGSNIFTGGSHGPDSWWIAEDNLILMNIIVYLNLWTTKPSASKLFNMQVTVQRQLIIKSTWESYDNSKSESK